MHDKSCCRKSLKKKEVEIELSGIFLTDPLSTYQLPSKLLQKNNTLYASNNSNKNIMNIMA